MRTYKETTVIDQPQLIIARDSDPESPREWSNLGYFITKDGNYFSPDKHDEFEKIISDCGDVAESQENHMHLIKNAIHRETDEKVLAIYPVVKYEHSGVSYSLGTCHGFDYSNNGFYIVTEKSAKEVGVKKKDFEKVIKQELETYNQYANGDVYSFSLNSPNGNFIDSCCGFYIIEDIRDHLPKNWKDVVLEDYIQD